MQTIITAAVIALNVLAAAGSSQTGSMSPVVQEFSVQLNEATGGVFEPDWHHKRPLERAILLSGDSDFASLRTIVARMAGQYYDVRIIDGWSYAKEEQAYQVRLLVGTNIVDVYYFTAYQVINIVQRKPKEDS
ncbi:hypothetical protein [Natronogracilivirga saccharolytica]|uniref:Uncharacterized protein n=1 Tax=Natronogracilivirga saccharolytica TaxID=2812953 RepID=A0A8J7UVX0_9BACT|nr:hypothetical protein [Natronogracilivirga saccharolytica]MBP3193895.1 hypothetical protein [Natronogracilivirga saccharolytica]